MAATTASGWLSCGQCPWVARMASSLCGMTRCMYSPTATGAMTSTAHWRMRLGVGHAGRSARESERNVTSANCFAIAGSVRQKLLASSSPISGRSGLPVMTGAIARDHPR